MATAKKDTKLKFVDRKLITCILAAGSALEVMERLKKEKDITTANLNHARGSGMVVPFGKKGVGQSIEKDILNVVVDSSRCDEIFEFIYEAAEIDRPHGGLLYVSRLSKTVDFELPDL